MADFRRGLDLDALFLAALFLAGDELREVFFEALRFLDAPAPEDAGFRFRLPRAPAFLFLAGIAGLRKDVRESKRKFRAQLAVQAQNWPSGCGSFDRLTPR